MSVTLRRAERRPGWNSGWSRDLRGPTGRPVCKWCLQEVQPGRRTWCSDECVHEYSVRNDPGYIRQKVGERDRGVCARCGMDTRTVDRQRIHDTFRRVSREVPSAPAGASPTVRRQRRERMVRRVATETGIAAAIVSAVCLEMRKTIWDADHIVAVEDGGAGLGLENIQTLCVACHRVKNRRQSRGRAG